MDFNKNQSQPPYRQAGFTLLEILVVLVILGLVAAVVAGPQIFKYLGTAKSEAAKVQIERLSGALDLYRLEVGSYPSEQEGLSALVEEPAGVGAKELGRAPVAAREKAVAGSNTNLTKG